MPALVLAEPAGDQRSGEGADVDGHVVEGEARVAPVVVRAVQLADHGGDVRLEQAGAGADQSEAGPGHGGGGHGHGVVAAGDEDAAPEHGPVGAEDPVGEPSAGDGDEVDHGPVGRRDGGRGARGHAQAAVRRRVGEVEDEDGLHAEEGEALPDLQPGEGGEAPRVAEEGVVVLGRRLFGRRIRGLVHLGRSSGQNVLSGCFGSSRTYRCSSGSVGRVAGKALSVIENRPDTLA